MMKTVSAKLDDETKSRMEKLFNTAHYVAKEGLAFKKFTGLCDLQEKNGLNIGNNYRNKIKCKEFVFSIAAIEQEKYAKEIRDARFLYVILIQMGDHRHSFLTLSLFSLPMLQV